MTAQVERAWASITTWLRREAPVTARGVRPPAATEEVLRVEADLGLAPPADLIAWWRLMDGFDDYRAGHVVPDRYQPLPVAEVRQRHVWMSEYADPGCCRGGEHRAAGTTGGGFCTATMPICQDIAGDLLVVDLRPGERSGGIAHYSTEQGLLPTAWPGVAAMLVDIAESLDGEADGPDMAVPEVIGDGVLVWIL